MPLTADFKQNIQNPATSGVGAPTLNQPMDSEAFKQWAQPTPAKPSSYDVAMGKTNADGTPNTDKGIIPEAFDQAKAGFKQTQEGAKNPDLIQGLQQIGRGTLNEMSAGIRAAFSPIEAGLKVVSQLPGFHQALGALQDHVINPVSDKISDIKPIQDFMKSNPNADEVFGNLVNIVGTIAGGKLGAKDTIVEGVEKAGNKISETAGKISDKIPPGPGGAKVSVVTPQAMLEKNAIRDTTPSYNKNLIGEPAIKGEDGTMTPRVSEINSKNPFAMRDVNSTASEVAAGKELSKVEGYNPKGTSLEKYNTVANDITKKSDAYRTSLDNEKVVIPKKEMTSIVKKAVNGASQDSLLLQKTDPIVKNYIRVAQRAADTVEGTLKGEDQLRLKLDQAYEDAGGKYGNNKGLDQIHRAARNAITKDMIEKAQTTQVKASLKQMENLYNAADVLKDKAQSEGGSKWEQFAKKYPVISKTVKGAGRAAGIAVGVHI